MKNYVAHLLLLCQCAPFIQSSSIPSQWSFLVRGGDNEERYSRQVYTLGQRAHGLIRSATVHLDGPLSSGLLYECAKNLALSGVGTIVILASDDDRGDSRQDTLYLYKPFDDLGRSYQLAARTELGVIETTDDLSLLQMYLQRLNPSVNVEVSDRNVELAADTVLISVDRPHSTQVRLNELCRQKRIKFVSIETSGVFGKVFCDFGPDFTIYDADGETPLEIPVDNLEVVDGDKVWVHCVDSERHDVSKGDFVDFRLGTGESIPDCKLEVLQIQSPIKFLARYIGDKNVQEMCSRLKDHRATCRRIKIPTNTSFLSLEVASKAAHSPETSLFAICDLDKSFDYYRRCAILSSFQALGEYIDSHGDYPSKETATVFQELASNHDQDVSEHKIWRQIVHNFAQTCKGKLTPVQGFIGAVGAQEALKAATGLYTPIQQFLLFDCDELILEGDTYEESENCNESNGQAFVLGSELNRLLSKAKLFIVGAGAIGCELLKNLAAMGALHLIITDMDTIEHSNLSRQLLFRDANIGSFKSVAAKEGVERHNRNVNVEIHTSKVGDDENSPFNDTFWEKIDVVLNALDNVDARLYVDQQCVAYQKALVDAGTLGSKGNVQVVVPFQSESYGSSVDPNEQAIPVCTLKNFPYLISHTIQWGRDLFEGYFDRRIKQLNDMVNLLQDNASDYVADKLRHDLGDGVSVDAAAELREDLMYIHLKDEQKLVEKAVEWAARCAWQLFSHNIEALLSQHPVGSLDEDGKPFWTGARRAPVPIAYAVGKKEDTWQAMVNDNIVAFVQNCARLRVESLCGTRNEKGMSMMIKKGTEDFFLKRKTPTTSHEEETIESILSQCKGLIDGIEKGWSQIAFEKDDESNGHVAFVAAASNLRAICYGISPVDKMETRRIAGQIVPAMITTTALVSSLSCIELLKLLKKTPFVKHRNAFVNFALPFFAFTMPVPAETTHVVGDRQFTLWDRIEIKESKKTFTKGGLTVSKLLLRILKKVGLAKETHQISSISYGPYMVYANYIHGDNTDLLDKPIWDVVGEAIQDGDEDLFASRDGVSGAGAGLVEALHQKRFIDVSVIVEENESGEEVEIPPVRIIRFDAASNP